MLSITTFILISYCICLAHIFYCVICNKDVEIKETKHLDEYDEQILSCGHTSKSYRRVPEVENVLISGHASKSKHIIRNIIEDPQLANSKEIKIEAKNVDDKISVTVSGDNGIRKEGLLDPNFSLRKEGDIFILNSPTIYADTVNIGSKRYNHNIY